MIFRRRVRKLIPCILEVIISLKSMGLKPNPELIAKRLGVRIKSVKEALRIAANEGLLKLDNYDLTEAGKNLVLSHRERFLHDRLIHRYPWSSIFRIRNFQSHWSTSHGLDSEGIRYLRSHLSSLNTRIEDVKPLSSLPPGSRGIVAFMVGGYGFIRRLADMGITPGIEISVLRNAPLGGPVVVQVRGSSIALGRGVASKVFIKVLED